MKLLFDQNISYRLPQKIQDIFPETAHVTDLGLGNSVDQQIWEFAKVNDFVIVTFDGDFYDLSLVRGKPPKIVWLRTFNQTTSNIEHILRKHECDLREFYRDSELSCLEVVNKTS